jgi:shikimate kinase
VIRPQCPCLGRVSFGHLYLVGYRCTGKTSVGRILAKRLRRPFVDGDAQVSAAAGMAISDIVSTEGWEGFRRWERRVMKDICRAGTTVVATGGGAVLDAGSRWDMRRKGIVVWLTASVAAIAFRMTVDPLSVGQRPALSRQPLAEEIASTLAARTPLYAQAAHIRILTDNRGLAGICDEIVVRLSSKITAMLRSDSQRRCCANHRAIAAPPAPLRHGRHHRGG